MVKILKIRAEGLPLYKQPLVLTFTAMQRVHESHMNAVSNLFGNVYVNHAEAFIGLNATGKTMTLNVISFVFSLLSAKPLNSIETPMLMYSDKNVTFNVDFFADGKLYHLKSEIAKKKQANRIDPNESESYLILNEKLWIRQVNTRMNKSHLFDYAGLEPTMERSTFEKYLPADVSIMVTLNKEMDGGIKFIDLTVFTNNNTFYTFGDFVPSEIISMLDPSIASISREGFNDKPCIKLKFKNGSEYTIFERYELNKYLSSGTIKGIYIFQILANVLELGGYMIVDELENHFNHELVATLLRIFLNKRTNPKGAVIIFSTHYPELLDELQRNDSVFITRKNDGLATENLNDLLKRNDLKKSEIYESSFLDGTAPKYSAIDAYRKSIIARLGG